MNLVHYHSIKAPIIEPSPLSLNDVHTHQNLINIESSPKLEYFVEQILKLSMKVSRFRGIVTNGGTHKDSCN